MAYATAEDIRSQLPEETLLQLTDDQGIDAVDETRVAEAIADADATIDGYCAGRYDVPFVEAPAILRKLSVDIAVYNLFSRRDNVPEARAQRYRDAVKLLGDISRGLVSLGKVPEPPQAAGKAAMVSGPDRVFSRDSMRGL